MAKKQTIVVVSGGFDPIHIGHVRMFEHAKSLGDKLIVILNNDNWLAAKKRHIFMPQDERREVIAGLRAVDEVVLTGHEPNPADMSVSREIAAIKPDIFANGGDRRQVSDVSEAPTCQAIGCKMVFDVGDGGKVQSSSWLLKDYLKKVNGAK